MDQNTTPAPSTTPPLAPIPNTSDQGRLQIMVFSKDIAKPLEGANITITETGTDKTVDKLVTSNVGKTPDINLATPPVEYSMEPYQPKPYGEYDLTIVAEGHQTAKINGVQILPGTLALQNIALTPFQELGQKTIIDIEQNTLYGIFPPKIPESPVKPLPPSKELVVLPQVVIPETIVVHGGVPNDKTAQNYYVPFKEYIKNVASCEIYSNWPYSTITANVLAILSFTLNRVYTEWYRGKGYNFTITNSTAFDHAFNYGRNIFSEISTVVDDIFTSYITKPDIRQPLLTQYCDGQRVSCPNWMTQWGSKYLGDQGYTAINILKHFYGQEIYLMQAEKVQGIPSSYPGYDLQMGSTGEAVRTIQTQLNAIAKNYPLIPKVKVDGVFGQDTLNAVKAFQNTFNLPATGIVDYPTWYKISDVFVAVQNLAELK
ncbi:MAG: peptidoglycan-binding protein [Bacillota bacterium]|nr:peptidoglycan-binding protein [Bacillota bacterium]